MRDRDIIEWAAGVEAAVGDYYAGVWKVFSTDKDICALAEQLAEDEYMHRDILLSALDVMAAEMGPRAVVVDADTKRDVEARLHHYAARIGITGFTEKDFVESVVELERHEVNKIFMYAIGGLKGHHELYEGALKNIKEHLGLVDAFVSVRPEYAHLAERLREIPDLGRNRILLVEDDPDMAELCMAFLENEGLVDNVSNGDEALELLGLNWYSAVIMEVEMPVEDGLEFYRRAVEKQPGIEERFLFLTGQVDVEQKAFIEEKAIRHLTKPATIKDIKRNVLEMIKMGQVVPGA